MPPVEVIDLSAEESDDDVQVVEVRQTGLPSHGQTNTSAQSNNEDVQIVGYGTATPSSREDTPTVIYLPDGATVWRGLPNAAEPERRSFESQRTTHPLPHTHTHTRTSAQVARQRIQAAERLRRMRNQAERNREVERLRDGYMRDFERAEQERFQRRIVANHIGPRFGNGDILGFFHALANDEDEDRDPDYNPARGFIRNRGRRGDYSDYDYDDDYDSDYISLTGAVRYPGGAAHFPRENFPWGLGQANTDIPDNIMQLIQDRENAEFDKKRATNLNHTNQVQRQLLEKAETIRAPYTSRIEEGEEYVCTLCGTSLGIGIPEDFEVDRKNTPLQKYQEQNDVQAPYQALKMVTDIDRDFSKRIFMAKCGHTYCGRCVKNISNIKGMVKEQKKKFKKTDISITNPLIYAPLTCVVPGCTIKLSGKSTFSEVFT